MEKTNLPLYVQFIFAVKFRANCIPQGKKSVIYQFIKTTLHSQGQKLLAIDGTESHIHILVELQAGTSISDLAKDLKRSSSLFINGNQWSPGKFYWQKGFAAFYHGESKLNAVIHYITNQEKYHRKMSFIQECIDLFVKYELGHKENFFFEFYH